MDERSSTSTQPTNAIEVHLSSLTDPNGQAPTQWYPALTDFRDLIHNDEHFDLLSDFVDAQLDRIRTVMLRREDSMDWTSTADDGAGVWYRTIVDALSPIVWFIQLSGHWHSEVHVDWWPTVIRRVSQLGSDLPADSRRPSSDTLATLVFYSLGMRALEMNNLPFIAALLSDGPFYGQGSDGLSSPDGLLVSSHIREETNRQFDGEAAVIELQHDWPLDILRAIAKPFRPYGRTDTRTFDELEVLMSLNALGPNQSSASWLPNRDFIVDNWYRITNFIDLVDKIEDSLSQHGEESPYVSSGIFGGTVEECTEALRNLKSL